MKGLKICTAVSARVQEDIRATDETIFTFVQSLAALDSNAPLVLKGFFIGIHATAYLSFVRLHDSVALTDIGAYTRCLQASRYIANLLGFFRENEIVYLSPSAMVRRILLFMPYDGYLHFR